MALPKQLHIWVGASSSIPIATYTQNHIQFSQ